MMRTKVCATFLEADDAKLSTLVVSGFTVHGELDLTNPNVRTFSIDVTSNNVAVQIFAVTSSQFASLNLNYIGFSTAMKSGEPTLPLGLGKKGTTRSWTIEVTAENGARLDYSIDIYREEN